MASPPTPDLPTDFERLGAIALVGHRGAGKSTLGQKVAARLDRPFFDLDDEITRHTGLSPAEILEADADKFRRLERATLAELCQLRPAPIVACGAGAAPICDDAFVVWLDRRDWRDEVKNSNRPRVRPRMSERAEWDWMEKTRPVRWRKVAHLRLPIPRGRTVEHSADDLATLLSWAGACAHSPLAQRTWLVPIDSDDSPRAAKDAHRLGAAGIEVRSDVFDEPPPAVHSGDVDYIASLRHDEPRWLAQFPTASAWDIDLRFVEATADANLGETADRLIVSSHPDRPSTDHIADLQNGAHRLAKAFDLSPDQIELKYVPPIASYDELDELVAIARNLRAQNRDSTILTSSRRFAWTRPIFAAQNATNYLPLGLKERRPDHPSALDLQQFLPHLAGPVAEFFDVLVGDPVDQSQGDLWHRRAALAGDEKPAGYLKVPVRRGQLDRALETFRSLPIRGISITSPLKIEAADSGLVDNRDDLPALNTLCRTPDDDRPWRGIDTDEDGMTASLNWFEDQDVGPGDVVIFGRGGASHALVRAIEKSDSTLVEHLSARAGWRPEHSDLGDVALIVCAAGPGDFRNEYTPTSGGWLDLHYTDVGAPPPDTVHLQGDLFFVAQARAQRRFWNLPQR